MTRYDVFDELKSLTSLTKTEQGYAKFIQTGGLSLWDYGTGFIELQIFTCKSPKRVTPSGPIEYDYSVRLGFSTIDDGDFGAWKPCSSKEEADELVGCVAELFRNMVKFPSDEELNILLRPYGLYATYE